MAKKYDLVIVGAGPAGLMAGRIAAENGLKVVILERKTDICKVRRFDGGVFAINEYTFGQLALYNERDKRISFPVGGFSTRYDGPYTNVFGFHLYSPGGKRLRFGDWTKLKDDPIKNRVAIALNKEILLKSMLDDCLATSVEVLPNVNVTAVKTGDNRVTVTGNGEEYEAPFLIAADGSNSRIARLAGFNKEREFFATSRHIGYEVEGMDYDELNGFIIALTQHGFYSILPYFEKGVNHIGHLTHDPSVDLHATMQWFIKESPVFSSWFKKAKVRETGLTGCVVNVYKALEDPFKDNVILVSDAAWIQEVSIPSAMCFGWKAANAVTLALHDGKPNREGVQSYLDWYGINFYQPHGNRKMVAIEMQKFLATEDLDYLAELPGKVFRQTMDFHYLFHMLGEIYGGDGMVKISEERPDIMEKLIDARGSMAEASEERKKMGFPGKK
jgi:digeranylgeranylglycerophospholipid reductase